MSPERRTDAILGCLLGTLVGDAVGLCCEGLSRRRQQRLFGEVRGPRLLGGRGMVSDDTEHAAMVGQALLASGGEPRLFGRALAGQLRASALTFPAGSGKATLTAMARLWLGAGPDGSGIASAGNGPAMRGPLLGACWGHDPTRLRELVRVSTRLTHTDARAEHGTLAVATAAHVAAGGPPDAGLVARYASALASVVGSDAPGLLGLVEQVLDSVAARQPTAEFADALGPAGGVSGYIYHTVPVALHAWLRHPGDLREAVLEAVHCGGDSDTVAAIVGGIVGAGVGKAGVPPEWLAAILEWPMGVAWVERLGLALAESNGVPGRTLPLPLPARALRGLFFTAVVLAHGFRRLAPPY